MTKLPSFGPEFFHASTTNDWNSPFFSAEIYHAINLANQYHWAQTDVHGFPYILHPLAVANRLPTKKQKAVAILHDLLEDTDCPFVKLKDYYTWSDDTLIAVWALTRQTDEPYRDFIKRIIKAGDLAMSVKIADLCENLSERRRHPSKERNRRKYFSAFDKLRQHVGNEHLVEIQTSLIC